MAFGEKQALLLLASTGPGHVLNVPSLTVPASKVSFGRPGNCVSKVARSLKVCNPPPVTDATGTCGWTGPLAVGCSQLMRARPSSELAATRRNADFMAPSVIGSSAVRRAPERTTQFNAQDRYRRWPGSHSFGDLDHTRLGRTQAGHCTARNAFTLPCP